NQQSFEEAMHQCSETLMNKSPEEAIADYLKAIESFPERLRGYRALLEAIGVIRSRGTRNCEFFERERKWAHKNILRLEPDNKQALEELRGTLYDLERQFQNRTTAKHGHASPEEERAHTRQLVDELMTPSL